MGPMRDLSHYSPSTHRSGAQEVVKRRSVRTQANALNRRSWPLAPGSIRQQLKDREKQEQLNELLNRYSTNGLPPLPDLLAIGKPTSVDEAVFDLEPHWKQFVDGHEKMPRKQQEHQEAVWELFITEVSFIRHLRVIIDVFKNSLINLQQEGLLNEIDTDKLFSNIVDIFDCNAAFFQTHLFPVLQQGRKFHQPLDFFVCKEAFVLHFPVMFQVYFKYFLDHKKCLEYAKLCMENDLFKTFITWAEAQKQCNRFKMTDLLVAPMQRLLKYSLLLHAVMKFTEHPKDKEDLSAMIKSVDKLCFDANQNLQRREDLERLEAVRKNIDSYDGIEAPTDECSKIVQEYNGNFDLVTPMPGSRNELRCFLCHTTLRMKEMQLPKMDVDCLLFTDLILICKNNRKQERFKVIRPPMSLNQLVVSELKDKGSFLLIYLNEYHVPISAFTFHGDVGVVKMWLERFKEAKNNLEKRKAESAVAAQEEVEYTPVNNSEPDLDCFPRSESIESTDRFIPNILTPNHPHYADLSRSGSTGDIRNRAYTTTSVPSGQGPGRYSPSPSASVSMGTLSGQPTEHSSLGGEGLRHTDSDLEYKHNVVQSCKSMPNSSGLDCESSSGNAQQPVTLLSQAQAQQHRLSADNGKAFSIVIEDASSFRPPNNVNSSSTHGVLSEQHLLEDDLAKMKLHSRRTSRTEKRYHTADAIQDMKNQDKDTSIHKRLSWRQEEQVHDHKNLGSKVLSSDSVRSIPSSSGVSSTGSLHLNLESDISEESEGNSMSAPTSNAAATKNAIGFSYSNDIDNSNNNTNSINNNVSSFNNNSLHLSGDRQSINTTRRQLLSSGDEAGEFVPVRNNVGGDDDDDDNVLSDLNPHSKQGMSKSTPDLAGMLTNSVQVSKMEDGIASVAMGAENFRRKLTHADIMKMKRLKEQILYDANIESSEV